MKLNLHVQTGFCMHSCLLCRNTSHTHTGDNQLRLCTAQHTITSSLAPQSHYIITGTTITSSLALSLHHHWHTLHRHWHHSHITSSLALPLRHHWHYHYIMFDMRLRNCAWSPKSGIQTVNLPKTLSIAII